MSWQLCSMQSQPYYSDIIHSNKLDNYKSMHSNDLRIYASAQQDLDLLYPQCYKFSFHPRHTIAEGESITKKLNGLAITVVVYTSSKYDFNLKINCNVMPVNNFSSFISIEKCNVLHNNCCKEMTSNSCCHSLSERWQQRNIDARQNTLQTQNT